MHINKTSVYKSDRIFIFSGESFLLVITGSAVEEMCPHGTKGCRPETPLSDEFPLFCSSLCSLCTIKADPLPVGCVTLTIT